MEMPTLLNPLLQDSNTGKYSSTFIDKMRFMVLDSKHKKKVHIDDQENP
jgi:hypothetical protein